jgi:hypothetical protein
MVRISSPFRVHWFTIAAATVASIVVAAAGQADPRYSQPQPVRPNLPGSPADEIGLAAAAPLVREGTFIASARGQAIKGKTGRWFMVFDPDAQGRVFPPMILLPNLNLAAVERSVERNPPGTRIVVTGVTTVYQNHNYLLLSAPPLLVRADAASTPSPATEPPTTASADPPPAEQPAAPAAAPASAPTPAAAGEPSIDDIVAKLDQAAGKVAALAPQRATKPTVVPATATPEPTAAGSDAGLLPPGLLASRRGRIFRTPDGALVFAIDNGPEPAVAMPPMILLPCQNLAALEQIAERAGEAATYTMSGEIVTYRGRNYLLPRNYQANRATDQVMPTQ